MTTWRRWLSRLTIEPLLMILILLGFGNSYHRFSIDGKLPQPFIFDVNDTFMDWFNTAYYAHNRGTYDIWGTVYPPLSFVFLQIFGRTSCYRNDPGYARGCDTVGIATILGFYALAVVIAYLAFRKADPRTALMRGTAFGLSMPMLFLLERGNLIIPCLPLYILAHGGLTRSRWVKAGAAALTINFKPYLLLPTLAWIVKRNWRLLELTAIGTMIVYALSYAKLGDGSPLQLFNNTLQWIRVTGAYVWEQIYYSTSYTPFLEFNTSRFPSRDFVPSKLFEPFIAAIPIMINASRALLAVCLVGAWLQPRALTAARISILLLCASLIGSSPGGYTMTFVIFLLFLEKWEGVGTIVALVAGYLLSIPVDYNLGNFVTLAGDSWLANRPVTGSFGLSVGMFVRPGLLVILFWAIAADSLVRIVRAHGTHRPLLAMRPPAAVPA